MKNRSHGFFIDKFLTFFIDKKYNDHFKDT